MIRAALTVAACLALCLVLCLSAACSLAPEWAGGDAGSSLDMEGDHTTEVSLGVGDPLTLEVRSPEPGGYELAGTYFDSDRLDMTSFKILPGEDGDPDQLEYLFTALAPGQALVEVRVRAKGIPDAPIEVYKRVLVTIEE